MLAKSDVKLGTDFFDDKERYLYIADKVVFTGMIDEFYGYRFGELEYRSLSFENEILDMPDFQGTAVVNYTSADVPYTRIIEHKHFEFGTQSKTVLTYEYPMEWSRGLEPFYPVNDNKNTVLLNKYRALADFEKNIVFGGRLGTYRYLDMWQVIKEARQLALTF